METLHIRPWSRSIKSHRLFPPSLAFVAHSSPHIRSSQPMSTSGGESPASYLTHNLYSARTCASSQHLTAPITRSHNLNINDLSTHACTPTQSQTLSPPHHKATAMTILICSTILQDEDESLKKWHALLTRRSSSCRVMTARELESSNEEEEERSRLLNEIHALLVVGIEPLKSLSPIKSEDQLLEQTVREHLELKGGGADLTEEEVEELIQKLALQAMVSSSTGAPVVMHDFDRPRHVQIVHELIQEMHRRKRPVIGVGNGSLDVCEALGVGEIVALPETKLRLDKVQLKQEAKAVGLSAGVDETEPIVVEVARIVRSKIENVRGNGRVLGTCELDGSAVLIGIPPLDESVSITTFALNASPEVDSESLVEHWLPLLDDHLLLSSTEALQALESIRESSTVSEDELGWMRWIKQLLGATEEQEGEEESKLVEDFGSREKEDGKAAMVISDKHLETIRLLELKVAVLEQENAELREEVARLRSTQTSATQEQEYKQPAKPLASRDDLAIRSLMLGIDILSTQEQVEHAESTVMRIVKENPISESGGESLPEKVRVAKASVLAVSYTNEQDLIYTTTDKTVHAVKMEDSARMEDDEMTQQVKLDAPPIFLAVSPRSVPSEIAIGTLAGSIHRFTRGADEVLTNHRVLPTKHKKHITGLVFDPTGTGKLASISRDGVLVLWNPQGEPIATFGFDEDKPPECMCSVMIDGDPFLAVAKRNDFRVALVPFEDVTHEEQKYFSLNDKPFDDAPAFTPLVMSAFKDLPVVAIATDKSRVILYDIRNGGKKLREFYGHVCDEFARPTISWNHSAKWLAVSSIPNKVFLFKVSQPNTPPVVLEDHTAAVRGLVFHSAMVNDEEKHFLTTGSFDRKVKTRQINV